MKHIDFVVKWSEELIVPHNKMFHYGILWQQTPEIDGKVEWLVIEAKGQDLGVHVYKLSDEEHMDLQFFRVSDTLATDEQRALSPWYAINYGTARYDFPLIFKLLWWIIRINIKRVFNGEKLGPATCGELAQYYHKDNKLNCTEIAYRGYADQGVYLFPKGWPVVPAAYQWALDMGNLERIE